jgi:hypothetical protein
MGRTDGSMTRGSNDDWRVIQPSPLANFPPE